MLSFVQPERFSRTFSGQSIANQFLDAGVEPYETANVCEV